MTTPHENLETKRRRNIVELNRSGACHICGCTSGSRSYRRFVGNDDDDDDRVDHRDRDRKEEGGSTVGGEIVAAAAITAAAAADDDDDDDDDLPPREIPMRTCMCHGNGGGQSSGSSRPFPLRVCEMCVADDAMSVTGRVRHCGICGVVACDDYCGVNGVSLVEVTDREEWNNAGCLECRGMESFGEMELFRSSRSRGRSAAGGGVASSSCVSLPRATRVCTGCVELFSLFSFGTKYQFGCRYFKCDRALLPSSIVELKRSMTPFPLNDLPDELLNSIVGFLGGKDLFSFGLVCTKIFRKVEQVSREIVARFNHELPTGPTQIVVQPRPEGDSGGKENAPKKTWRLVYAEGKNGQSLSPPDDGTTWVGVLNQMEQLTRSIYYFDFQMTTGAAGGGGGDDGAAMRYLRRPDKLSFDRAYSKPPGNAGAMSPLHLEDSSGLSMRGGQVLVTRYRWYNTPEDRNDRNIDIIFRSIIFSTNGSLESGMHRAIVRYNCLSEGPSLGCIGILRRREEGDDGGSPDFAWQASWTIPAPFRSEEHVFGMEYDADRRALRIYKRNIKTNAMEPTTADGSAMDVANEGGTLCFAASLSSGSVGFKGNQLSVRSCDACEWSAFLVHRAKARAIPRVGRGLVGRGGRPRGGERLMRFLDHRARRAMMAGDDDDDGDVASRIQVERMMDMMEREIELEDIDSDIEDVMNVEDHIEDAIDLELEDRAVPPLPDL
jgi:hypothetical protein